MPRCSFANTTKKFEEIRSRWEAAQLLSRDPSDMVGRKVKPAARQPSGTGQNSDGSTLRRKFSHGLSFNWNPLGQRKTTPSRLPVGTPVRVNGTRFSIQTPVPRESDALLSSTSASSSVNSSPKQRATSDHRTTEANLDTDATPKALPRSRTMSYIPRPSRSGSESSVVESDHETKAFSPTFTFNQACAAPSKIPSPTPTVQERRLSSPRQHIPSLTMQQAKYVAAGEAFAEAWDLSPSKKSARSQTTPNFMKHRRSPAMSGFMVPRKQMSQRDSSIPGPQRPTLKENMRSCQPDHRRLSQIHESSPKGPSPGAPRNMSNRRSLGPSNDLTQGKQAARTTPTKAGKRLSSQAAPPTPLTAQRTSVNKQSPRKSTKSYPNAEGSTIAQPRLMGPVNPPSPPSIDPAVAQPALPRASTDRDLHRKTFTPGSRRSGSGMPWRARGAGSNEVRRLPRSPLNPYARPGETVPPVPAIPEWARAPSLPVLPRVVRTPVVDPGTPQRRRVVSAGRSTPTRPSGGLKTDVLASLVSTPNVYSFGSKTEKKAFSEWSPQEPIPTLNEYAGEHVDQAPPNFAANAFPNPFLGFDLSEASLSLHCSSSFNNLFEDKFADVDSDEQVKDYMPARYWAGRFQSRFDHWRTEATKAEINKNYKPTGDLSQCKLNNEREAICHIFVQLRDLCITHQAADSLWEFEYKYRQDNKMLGATPNLQSLLSRKQTESTSKQGPGPIGRAVRKLTPRKSSFVNLLKGKGWNKEQDTKSSEGPIDFGLPQIKKDSSSRGSPGSVD